ncbi:MAG: DUF3343 domain-containing protein [Anaerolineaceae bacterium]|nr:DUF3343 domain-containing protein [Anaerolineaceae bacterium]
MKNHHMVILVDSTSHALRIEQILVRHLIPCKMIPVPRHLSSDCGVCVRIEAGDWEKIKELLVQQKAAYREVHGL